jgi:hypothetical protein
MIYRGTKEEVQEYFDSDAISQSRLKLLGFNTVFFFQTELIEGKEKTELYYDEKEHFVKGSYVDDLITRPETINELYFECDCDKPKNSGLMAAIHELVAENIGLDLSVEELQNAHNDLIDSEEQSTLEKIENILNSNNAYTSWKFPRRYEKLLENKDYYNVIFEAGDRQIIDKSELDICRKIVDSFMTNPQTAFFFEESYDVDLYYQIPLYWTTSLGDNLEEIHCKGLPDLVRVDHFNKTILLLDIKTLGDKTYKFPSSIYKRGYNLQLAWYLKGLIKKFDDLIQDGYKLELPILIVESTTQPGYPDFFELTPTDMEIANEGYLKTQGIIKNGEELKFIGTNRYGILDLLSILKYCLENNIREENYHQYIKRQKYVGRS